MATQAQKVRLALFLLVCSGVLFFFFVVLPSRNIYICVTDLAASKEKVRNVGETCYAKNIFDSISGKAESRVIISWRQQQKLVPSIKEGEALIYGCCCRICCLEFA